MNGRPLDEDGHYEVLCAKDQTYEISDLWEQLTVSECINLAKKPKIFIIEVITSEISTENVLIFAFYRGTGALVQTNYCAEILIGLHLIHRFC